jgi:hypothetical protein
MRKHDPVLVVATVFGLGALAFIAWTLYSIASAPASPAVPWSRDLGAAEEVRATIELGEAHMRQLEAQGRR